MKLAWASAHGQRSRRIRTSRACADAFTGTSPQLYTVGERPRQQLAYLAVKRWARLYCPDVILGVYTADEIDEREERVINPAQTEKVTLNEITLRWRFHQHARACI